VEENVAGGGGGKWERKNMGGYREGGGGVDKVEGRISAREGGDCKGRMGGRGIWGGGGRPSLPFSQGRCEPTSEGMKRKRTVFPKAVQDQNRIRTRLQVRERKEGTPISRKGGKGRNMWADQARAEEKRPSNKIRKWGWVEKVANLRGKSGKGKV